MQKIECIEEVAEGATCSCGSTKAGMNELINKQINKYID